MNECLPSNRPFLWLYLPPSKCLSHLTIKLSKCQISISKKSCLPYLKNSFWCY